MSFHIAINQDTKEAKIVDLKLSSGVLPKLPKYRFMGEFSTKGEAKKSLPIGVKFEGKLVGEKP